MDTQHTIIRGDSREMLELEDGSVQLAITSPPYWQLKDYGPEKQTGFHQSYEDYINHLNLTWNECFRVLESGCRLCINIGDQFARAAYYGRYKVIPIRTEIIKFCESRGFDYMGAVIWQKVTTTNTSGGATIMGSFPNPRNGILKLDYEFILLFKKPGKNKKIEKETKEQSKMTTEEWNTFFSGHWNFPGVRQKGHIAMFPEELPRRLIKMFSFVGEKILDPFGGSGTTSMAAANNQRNSVMFEINEEFAQLAEANISSISNTKLTVQIQKVNVHDFKKQIKQLPYVFKDPLPLNEKELVKRKNYGSQINGKEKDKPEYCSVREITAPDLILLNNNQKVRLAGLDYSRQINEAAIASFLRDMLTGKSLHVEMEEKIEADRSEHRFVYLYLKNKTFINGHVIKHGLADPDLSRDYVRKKQLVRFAEKRDKKIT